MLSDQLDLHPIYLRVRSGFGLTEDFSCDGEVPKLVGPPNVVGNR